MNVNVSIVLLADCCPKQCAVDSNYLLVEMLDGILIFRTVVLARKTRKQRQPVFSGVLKASCRHRSWKIMMVVYCLLV